MLKSNNKIYWENNLFWKDKKSRLDAYWSNFSGERLFTDKKNKWRQACSLKGASQIALLQNKYTAIDVTDHGFCVCPMILNGRYYGRVNFNIDTGNEIINTGLWEYETKKTIINTEVLYELDYMSVIEKSGDLQFQVRTIIPNSFPFIIIELIIESNKNNDIILTPEIFWMPGNLSFFKESGIIWLKPRHLDLADNILSRNNSITADPRRPKDGKTAGIGISYSNNVNIVDYQMEKIDSKSKILLCDRKFVLDELGIIRLHPIKLEFIDNRITFPVIFGICESEKDYFSRLQVWKKLRSNEKENKKNYWSVISDNLKVECCDPKIQIQSQYSIRNSLFSRSKFSENKTIFIHGRPDRGYGDCSKLHQSYQMYYVALAAGQEKDVRNEILAFAENQNDNGNLAIQLKPGNGFHLYAGMYSNAKFIMALYRYICWTGDLDFISNMAKNNTSGLDITILERAKLAASWLLENRNNGLIKPCGWSDAWPPKVIAQAQTSIATYMALIELSKILFFIDNNKEGDYYKKEALCLAKNIQDIFFNDTNGLFAEHLFESGEVRGGQINDFWASTQVWAALAGLAPDSRGLEICKEYCLENGMTIIPQTVVETDYIKDSTDGIEDLNIDSTATWLRAIWPELTHLYAIAEIKYGRVEQALDAVIKQLPENIHFQNPHASPYYYAEKYIYPYNIPWLCTWSGDPTLIQVLLEGFGGLELSINGLKIKPRIPKEWKNMGGYKIRFFWRRRKIQLIVNGYGKEIKEIKVNNKEFIPDKEITPEMLDFNKTNNIIVSF